jgi:hypothetical protein
MKSLTAFVAVGHTPNVEFKVIRPDGTVRRQWQDNLFGLMVLRFVRKHFPDSYLAIQGVRVPVLLGMWSDSKLVRNKIVNAGLALAAGLLNGSGSPTTPTYIAVGTGTNAVAAADTTLQTETATSGVSRAAATVSLVTTSVTNDTAQWLKSFSVSGTVAVTESGVFNASSSGTLLCRQTFSAINVVNGDTLQITWKIQETSQN